MTAFLPADMKTTGEYNINYTVATNSVANIRRMLLQDETESVGQAGKQRALRSLELCKGQSFFITPCEAAQKNIIQERYTA